MQQPIHQLKINTLLLLLIIALISSNSYAGRWLTTDWVVECIDPVNCEPANEVLASQLKKAVYG